MTAKKSDKNNTQSASGESGRKSSSRSGASSGRNSARKAVDNFVYDTLKDVLEFAKKRIVSQNWQKLARSIKLANKRYSGQAIAILGPPAAGKTTLLKLLANQHTAEDSLAGYSKTEIEKHSAIPAEFKLHLDSAEPIVFRFKIKKNSDVGGEEYVRDQHWKSVIEGAAIVIYMIDSAQIIQEDSNEYRARVVSDFDWIRDNHQSLRVDFSVVIAFNKIDELCAVENYFDFSRENMRYIENLKDDIAKRWPPHLKDHLKGGLFLSVLHPGLRAFTLNALVSCFVGDDLMHLLRGAEKGA